MMRVQLLSLLALLGVFAVQFGKAEKESCDLGLYLGIDASGSMDDRDPECLEALRKRHGKPGYRSKKPCWEIITTFAEAAHTMVRYVCRAANQPDPKTSIVIFRCPDSGKEYKALLEPTNNPAKIADAFALLPDQKTAGYSCAYGTLDVIRDWIKLENNDTSSDYDERSESTGETKIPVVLMLSDGKLTSADEGKSIRVAKSLAKKFDTILAASTVMTKESEPNALKHLRDFTLIDDLILNATDPNSLNKLQIQLGVSTADLPACSLEQKQCILRRAAVLSENNTDSCDSLEDVFTGIASCVGEGCAGIDLSVFKDTCLEVDNGLSALGSCARNGDGAPRRSICYDIATHINSQSALRDPSAGVGFEETSKTPGFAVHGRRFDNVDFSSVQELQLDWDLSGAGSSGTPIEMNTGKIAVATKDGTIRAMDPQSGNVAWTFQSPAKASRFTASPIVGANGADDLFVGDNLGQFYRVNEKTGEMKRMWNLGGAIRSAAALLNGTEQVIVLTDGLPHIRQPVLHKLGLSSKYDSWRRPVCKDSSILGISLTMDQSVMVLCRHRLEKYSSATGIEQYSKDITMNGEVVATSSAPVVDENDATYIIVSKLVGDDKKSYVQKYGAKGGRVYSIAVDEAVVTSLPVFGSDALLVLGNNGILYKIDYASGEIMAKSETSLVPGQLSHCDPALDTTNSLLITCANNGKKLAIINVNDLTLVSETPLETMATNSPLLMDKAIYISTRSSTLSKLSGSQGRRVLSSTDSSNPENNSWPVAAIVLTVLLAILCVILSFVLWKQYKQEQQ